MEAFFSHWYVILGLVVVALGLFIELNRTLAKQSANRVKHMGWH